MLNTIDPSDCREKANKEQTEIKRRCHWHDDTVVRN
jgi:hypothetical protein